MKRGNIKPKFNEDKNEKFIKNINEYPIDIKSQNDSNQIKDPNNLNIIYRKDGDIDLRCQYAKYLKKNGLLPEIKQIEETKIIYRKDGELDQRSKYAKSINLKKENLKKTPYPRILFFEGKILPFCKAISLNYILLDKNNKILNESPSIQDGIIKLTKTGEVDKRISSYKNGEIKELLNGNEYEFSIDFFTAILSNKNEKSYYKDLNPLNYLINSNNYEEKYEQKIIDLIFNERNSCTIEMYKRIFFIIGFINSLSNDEINESINFIRNVLLFYIE